jgi:LysR family hydrogen peroxide-inducible transcriptional activator
VLVPLREQYPQIRLVLSEELTDTLIQRLRKHEIDAALLATPVEDSDLEAMPLFSEPFWLALPATHPLYEKDDISRRDLDHIDLLLLAEGHCLAEQAMEVCRMKDRSDKGDMADLRAASLETLLQLVGAGFGCTLVPALAVRGAWMTDTGIVVRPLKLRDAQRRVSLVFRRSFPRRPALEAFAQTIRDNLPNTVKLVGGDAPRRRKSVR